jgi:hypothetical protein
MLYILPPLWLFERQQHIAHVLDQNAYPIALIHQLSCSGEVRLPYYMSSIVSTLHASFQTHVKIVKTWTRSAFAPFDVC